MANTIEIYYEGARCGALQMEKRGLYLSFCGQCKAPTQQILRAYLQLDEGSIPLGVAVPEGDTLLISKTVPASRVLPHRPQRAYLQAGGPDGYAPWQGILMGYACQGLIRKTETGAVLALPFDKREPFGPMELISLFSYAEIDEKPFLTIQVDADGQPMVPSAAAFPSTPEAVQTQTGLPDA